MGLAARRERPVGGISPDPLALAIGWLARRDFCSAQLAERLAARGHDAASVQATLAELIERRYLNDERYAQQFVSARAARGQGPVRIRHDLCALGLPSEQVEAALQAHMDPGGWTALAAQVRRQRFGAEAPTGRAEWARQARFLQYRGFSTDHIRGALGVSGDPD